MTAEHGAGMHKSLKISLCLPTDSKRRFVANPIACCCCKKYFPRSVSSFDFINVFIFHIILSLCFFPRESGTEITRSDFFFVVRIELRRNCELFAHFNRNIFPVDKQVQKQHFARTEKYVCSGNGWKYENTCTMHSAMGLSNRIRTLLMKRTICAKLSFQKLWLRDGSAANLSMSKLSSLNSTLSYCMQFNGRIGWMSFWH